LSCSPREPLAQTRAWRARNRDAINAARRVEHPTRTCIVCGASFVAATSLARYCSESCRGRLRRQRHYLTYAQYHRLRREVIARYGTICYLCGQPVCADLPHRHPQSLTLDHVVPWSAGGLDTPENLRVAHMICNVEKSDRPPTWWERQAASG
jgi:5-methylcytosine-specific restriction endonuclease McrA